MWIGIKYYGLYLFQFNLNFRFNDYSLTILRFVSLKRDFSLLKIRYHRYWPMHTHFEILGIKFIKGDD